ncbi:MAG: class I SAM-dependent methyltransferase [Burkholderiaceae bacterium]|nr:class I SAM-dependent methyltransferase [Burkholderiaceae bacterium]
MDDWPASRFQQDIYNADYIKVDPPIPGREHVPVRERPAYGIGQSIASCFDGNQSSIRVLDFGSGGDPGPTGLALQDRGFQVFSYDPYRAGTGLPDGTFALIVAIEVFEHCHDLEALARFMRERLAEDGVLWIQTLLHPHPTPKDVLSSWYIAPRNGHISIFTFPSLSALFRRFGINIVATASGLFGLKKMPGFRNGLFV